MWNKLGFKESPYDTKPLTVSKSDVDLLMGRENEKIDFLTAMESQKQGIFIISGVPGVGKTSFLNIQQYLLESGEAEFGPQLLATRSLCPIEPYDEPKNIAKRCVQNFCISIEKYCIEKGMKVPNMCSTVLSWIYQNKPSTFNFGFSILGTGGNYGREVNLPSFSDITYESLIEIIKNLTAEVKVQLGFKGCFIALDNIENLYEDELNQCLTTFRDTLFMIPDIWWILIGQSGLSSLIQSTNPKVYQRISGSIELKPISVENLIDAVNIRVERFHEIGSKGSSPITKEIYVKLFESSNGEIRFVFNYCNAICLHLVQNIRKSLNAQNFKIDDANFNRQMGKFLIKKQIDNKYSNECLKELINEEFNGLHLTLTEKQVLKKIGNMKKVSPNDFRDFGVKTMQKFTENFLTKLNKQQILLRRQEGKSITYELRGISVFALEFGLLD
jgi:hypothetical protein